MLNYLFEAEDVHQEQQRVSPLLLVVLPRAPKPRLIFRLTPRVPSQLNVGTYTYESMYEEEESFVGDDKTLIDNGPSSKSSKSVLRSLEF